MPKAPVHTSCCSFAAFGGELLFVFAIFGLFAPNL